MTEQKSIMVDQAGHEVEDTGPCVCQSGPTVMHGGHCCFAAGDLDDYGPAKPMPCGHDVPGGL